MDHTEQKEREEKKKQKEKQKGKKREKEKRKELSFEEENYKNFEVTRRQERRKALLDTHRLYHLQLKNQLLKEQLRAMMVEPVDPPPSLFNEFNSSSDRKFSHYFIYLGPHTLSCPSNLFLIRRCGPNPGLVYLKSQII